MRKKLAIPILILFIVIAFFTMPEQLAAQTDSAAAETVKEEAKSFAPLIEFITIQKNDNSVDLKASIKAKIKGVLTKLEDLKIEFYNEIDSGSKKLGEVFTNSNGVALFNCKADQLSADAEGKLNFKAVFAGKDSIEAGEQTVAVKRARLEITPVKEDSILTVKLKLVDLSTGTETAVAETDLGVFVKRMFSNLKLGEGKTDEAGETSVEIPNALPGDDKGNITLIGKLDESESYGYLEATVVQKWGAPVSYEVKELPRALWSPHPPVWMLITFIVLMTVVWGHYIVIILELFRLRKEEPKTT